MVEEGCFELVCGMEALFGGWRQPAVAIGGKIRKRTDEVMLLLLYVEPKLPNLSIPAVSQNSGSGIFRKSNQEDVLCF